MVPDFSGYVTRYGRKCTDGRTILAHAFKEQDGVQVPLVWQHQHDAPENVLGHFVLRHRDDGMYGEAFFNDTPSGLMAKKLVLHKDMKNLSIYANKLVQRGKDVLHGTILEASLVMAGANPGAFIDNIAVQHGENIDVIAEEAIIYTDEELVHADTGSSDGGTGTSADEGPTVEEIIQSMSQPQRDVMYALIGQAMQHSVTATGTEDGADDSATHNNDAQEGKTVTRNVFDQNKDKQGAEAGNTATLSHADAQGIFADAMKCGSLKEAVSNYVLEHGIDSIETLFPYDQAVQNTPEFIARRTEWVAGVLGGVRKTPFSRIRSMTADITMDEARAKGYIKGNMKKEEFFKVARRITLPKTIYKKQKLDRDDILDITDFDVVTWIQQEMRIMLDEELARAVLIGDGRDIDDPDKIDEDSIRPIVTDDELYVTRLNVNIDDANSTNDEIVDAVVTGMRFYRGSGNPVFYTTLIVLSKLLLIKDTLGRRLYNNKAEVASAMGVRDIVPCEVLETEDDLIGIIVNLSDYVIGADKGGQVSTFDFFDIDFNTYKYLIETRCSGAMVKYKGALVVNKTDSATVILAEAEMPTFVTETGVVTVPTVTHVTYVIVDINGTEGSALTPGAQTALAAGQSAHYRAKAASGYVFPDDASADWTFTRPA